MTQPDGACCERGQVQGPTSTEHGAPQTPDPRPQWTPEPRRPQGIGIGIGIGLGKLGPPWSLAPLTPGGSGSPLPTGGSGVVAAGCGLWRPLAVGLFPLAVIVACCLITTHHTALHATRYTPHATTTTRRHTPHDGARRAARAWHCVGVGRYAICDMGTGTRGARRARGALEARSRRRATPCLLAAASW
jgi:hypothetical protein